MSEHAPTADLVRPEQPGGVVPPAAAPDPDRKPPPHATFQAGAAAATVGAMLACVSGVLPAVSLPDNLLSTPPTTLLGLTGAGTGTLVRYVICAVAIVVLTRRYARVRQGSWGIFVAAAVLAGGAVVDMSGDLSGLYEFEDFTSAGPLDPSAFTPSYAFYVAIAGGVLAALGGALMYGVRRDAA